MKKGKITGRFRSDRGDSLISMILVLPLMLTLIVSMLDFGFFLNNSSKVVNAARDGARTVAILGGDQTTGNQLALKYGALDPYPDCTPGYSQIQCSLQNRLEVSRMVQSRIDSIQCGPGLTARVGEKTECVIEWEYVGLPMSSLGFIPGFGEVTTVGNASAETGNLGTYR